MHINRLPMKLTRQQEAAVHTLLSLCARTIPNYWPSFVDSVLFRTVVRDTILNLAIIFRTNPERERLLKEFLEIAGYEGGKYE
jgi:hypothetical protein